MWHKPHNSCGACAHFALLREPLIGLADHFSTPRTGVCAGSYDGARVLLVSELFGSLCARYEQREIDLVAALTSEAE